ncbi:aspartate carbamoyltransferase [Variovorax boronicumulans]|uniref:aspartate carbamoyltransferase n=1 Tax=Variovorax boronicumulans TaxID=436515 RepID=UPI002787D26D|nr:aspartate carbamoyltransferase [Variovorax boronicumulans]MDQ0041971.1 aspartate carbamoyltransferase catalytic subunit [Variovorax boronicumulans]
MREYKNDLGRAKSKKHRLNELDAKVGEIRREVICQGPAFQNKLLKGNGMQDLISIEDLSRGDIENLFSTVDHLRRTPDAFRHALAGRVVCTLFFEPSTRTRLGFEAAAYRLGARVLSVSDMRNTRLELGESLLDTTRMVGFYCDAVVARHVEDGVMHRIKETVRVPLINAGEGQVRHPSQTLIDLYTLHEHFGAIDNLHVGIAGGIRYSRAAKSLIAGLRKFSNIRLHLVDAAREMDEGTEFPRELGELNGVSALEYSSMKEMIGHVDVVYVVRVQQEKFTDPVAYQRQLHKCRLHRALLSRASPSLVVMHCLPRADELDTDIDDTPQNKYFQQARHGVVVRSAVLLRCLDADSRRGAFGRGKSW